MIYENTKLKLLFFVENSVVFFLLFRWLDGKWMKWRSETIKLHEEMYQIKRPQEIGRLQETVLFVTSTVRLKYSSKPSS